MRGDERKEKCHLKERIGIKIKGMENNHKERREKMKKIKVEGEERKVLMAGGIKDKIKDKNGCTIYQCKHKDMVFIKIMVLIAN